MSKDGRMNVASRRPRVDEVTDRLRHAILSHRFQPGDRLRAESLAVEFAVSPTPLREAFARLAGEGLVTYHPQRGVRVAAISLAEMEEIYELRELLEPMAIRRSVVAGDDAWRSGLAAAFDAMQAIGGDHPEGLGLDAYIAYEEAHVAFHKQALSACDSGWLTRMCAVLTDHSRRFRQVSLPLRADNSSILAEHHEILEACLNGDADAAASAHTQHMARTRDALRRWADGQGVGEPGS